MGENVPVTGFNVRKHPRQTPVPFAPTRFDWTFGAGPPAEQRTFQPGVAGAPSQEDLLLERARTQPSLSQWRGYFDQEYVPPTPTPPPDTSAYTGYEQLPVPFRGFSATPVLPTTPEQERARQTQLEQAVTALEEPRFTTFKAMSNEQIDQMIPMLEEQIEMLRQREGLARDRTGGYGRRNVEIADPEVRERVRRQHLAQFGYEPDWMRSPEQTEAAGIAMEMTARLNQLKAMRSPEGPGRFHYGVGRFDYSENMPRNVLEWATAFSDLMQRAAAVTLKNVDPITNDRTRQLEEDLLAAFRRKFNREPSFVERSKIMTDSLKLPYGVVGATELGLELLVEEMFMPWGIGYRGTKAAITAGIESANTTVKAASAFGVRSILDPSARQIARSGVPFGATDDAEEAALRLFDTEDAKAQADLEARERIIAGQQGGQAGFGIGERPQQGLLGTTVGDSGEVSPLIDADAIKRQQARQAEIAAGQAEMPTTARIGVEPLTKEPTTESVRVNYGIDMRTGRENPGELVERPLTDTIRTLMDVEKSDPDRFIGSRTRDGVFRVVDEKGSEMPQLSWAAENGLIEIVDETFVPGRGWIPGEGSGGRLVEVPGAIDHYLETGLVPGPTKMPTTAAPVTPVAAAVRAYQGVHTPNPEGPRGNDLLEADIAPDDIYDNPTFYMGERTGPVAEETIAAINRMRGNPEATITIYRSAPTAEPRLNTGDWVSPSKTYARKHGMGAEDAADDWPVYEFQVKAKDIRWAGDSLEEWGYYPTTTAPSPVAGLTEEVAAAPKDLVTDVDPNTIITKSEHQPRQEAARGEGEYVEHDVQRLIDTWNIEAFEPIVVHREGGKYVLIHGHNRLEAVKRLGINVPSMTVLDVTPDQAIVLSRRANLVGMNLTIPDIAKVLSDELAAGATPEEILATIPAVKGEQGLLAHKVAGYAAINDLPDVVKDALRTGYLSNFTRNHGIALAEAMQKHQIPPDQIQKFFNEVLVNEAYSPTKITDLFDEFSPAFRKKASGMQGDLFSVKEIDTEWVGFMQLLREAQKAIDDHKKTFKAARRLMRDIDKGGPGVAPGLKASLPAQRKIVANLETKMEEAIARVHGDVIHPGSVAAEAGGISRPDIMTSRTVTPSPVTAGTQPGLDPSGLPSTSTRTSVPSSTSRQTVPATQQGFTTTTAPLDASDPFMVPRDPRSSAIPEPPHVQETLTQIARGAERADVTSDWLENTPTVPLGPPPMVPRDPGMKPPPAADSTAHPVMQGSDDLDVLFTEAQRIRPMADEMLRELWPDGFATSRLKTMERITEKLTAATYGGARSAEEISDYYGARVITADPEDVILEKLQRIGEVLPGDVGVDRKVRPEGYEALHIQVRLKDSPLSLEVQFSSPKIGLGQEVSHTFYEIMRTPSFPRDIFYRAVAASRVLFDNIPDTVTATQAIAFQQNKIIPEVLREAIDASKAIWASSAPIPDDLWQRIQMARPPGTAESVMRLPQPEEIRMMFDKPMAMEPGRNVHTMHEGIKLRQVDDLPPLQQQVVQEAATATAAGTPPVLWTPEATAATRAIETLQMLPGDSSITIGGQTTRIVDGKVVQPATTATQVAKRSVNEKRADNRVVRTHNGVEKRSTAAEKRAPSTTVEQYLLFDEDYLPGHGKTTAAGGGRRRPPGGRKGTALLEPEDADDMAVLREELEAGVPPGQDPLKWEAAKYESVLTTENSLANTEMLEGNDLLSRHVGVKTRGGLAVGSPDDIAIMDRVYAHVQHPKKYPMPEGMEDVVALVRAQVKAEELLTVAHDPNLNTVEDYMYRGWKHPALTGAISPKALDLHGVSRADDARVRAAQILAGKAPSQKLTRRGDPTLGAVPAHLKPRNALDYYEMRALGWEPVSWNIFEQIRIRKTMGVRHRAQDTLLKNLKAFGEDMIRPTPDINEGIPAGWRIPQIGPVFEGKTFAMIDEAGNPVIKRQHAYMVPDGMADALEVIFKRKPDDPNDVQKWIDFFAFGGKRAKLFGTFFQQRDFIQREAGAHFARAVDDLISGHPFEAVKSLAIIPKRVADMIHANFNPNYRKTIRRWFDSKEELVKGRPGLTPYLVSHSGLSTRDVTYLLEDISDLARVWAPKNKARWVANQVTELESLMSRGLFNGVYPAAISGYIKIIAPMMARMYGKNLTDEALAGAIAQQANLAFSTIPEMQSVLSHSMRQIGKRVFFSMNENEGLLRQAFGVAKGPYKRFWATHWIGQYLFLMATANLVHFASTGEPLPTSRYSPITMTPHKDALLPIGYNVSFMAPNIPILDRSGGQVMLDLVGQMDTALRVLDPVGFVEARFSVPVSAGKNQIMGTDYFGADITQVGPGGVTSRMVQLARDMYGPIGAEPMISMMLRQHSDTARRLFAESEERVNFKGNLLQTTGLNVRAQNTPMMMLRAAKEMNMTVEYDGIGDPKLNSVKGDPIVHISQLSPSQRQLIKDDPNFGAELDRRQETAAIRGDAFSQWGMGRDKTNEKALRQETGAAISMRTDWQPEKFGETLKDIGDERRVANRERAVAFGLFDEEPDIEDEDIYSKARREYFDAWTRSEKVDGQTDFDKFEEILASYDWSPEQASYIDNEISQVKHDPLVELRRADMNMLDDVGYFDIGKDIAENIPEEARVLFMEWMEASDGRQRVLEDRYKWINDIAQSVRKMRDGILIRNPVLDVARVRWWGDKPRTVQGFAEFQRLYTGDYPDLTAVDQDIAGMTAKTTQTGLKLPPLLGAPSPVQAAPRPATEPPPPLPGRIKLGPAPAGVR